MKEGKRQSGMTLVEVLMVIALIVILVSMVLVATNRSRADMEQKLTRGMIELLDSALQEYYEYRDAFPNAELLPQTAFGDDVIRRHNASLYFQLNSVPDSKKILLKIKDSQLRQDGDYIEIVDSWGTVFDYIYDSAAMSFPTIISAGPDRDFARTVDNIENKR